MKIREAQDRYRGQVKAYHAQRQAVSRQLKDVKKRMEASPDAAEKYAAQGVALELGIGALEQKQEEYQDYLNRLSEKYWAHWNAAAARQQADAAEEYAEDMGKIMEVARRLMKGGIVPVSDEKKLMEFSFDMYQMAKNIGSMARQQKKDKYETLWGEEEEKELEDPQEAAENAQAVSDAPEIESPADTVAAAAQP